MPGNKQNACRPFLTGHSTNANITKRCETENVTTSRHVTRPRTSPHHVTSPDRERHHITSRHQTENVTTSWHKMSGRIPSGPVLASLGGVFVCFRSVSDKHSDQTVRKESSHKFSSSGVSFRRQWLIHNHRPVSAGAIHVQGPSPGALPRGHGARARQTGRGNRIGQASSAAHWRRRGARGARRAACAAFVAAHNGAPPAAVSTATPLSAIGHAGPRR